MDKQEEIASNQAARFAQVFMVGNIRISPQAITTPLWGDMPGTLFRAKLG
jgi:hypothetical protein